MVHAGGSDTSDLVVDYDDSSFIEVGIGGGGGGGG
jgi:hypothetical protein